MSETILVINAGSSSIKFELFAVGRGDTLSRTLRGRVEEIGHRPRLLIRDAEGVTIMDASHPAIQAADHEQAILCVQQALRDRVGAGWPDAIGHRVAHGGPLHSAPTAIDDEVIDHLARLTPFAPLHQPINLAPIKAIRQRAPQLLQVACFDTAFHRTHPALADRYALPDFLYEDGIRRYGFHGLSYEYIASRLPDVAPDIAEGRVIVAHLGSGASMCAMVGRRSVESTMGFTTIDGLPMGTRPGQLDPGVVLYLLTEKKMTPETAQRFLYTECGLKGLSGISGDVRELEASSDPRAGLALEYFAYHVALLAGSLVAAMGGIDGFVFTAGIGENDILMRKRIARGLAWLGLELDPAANEAGGPRISGRHSAFASYVIPTDEELMIGRHTLDILRSHQNSG